MVTLTVNITDMGKIVSVEYKVSDQIGTESEIEVLNLFTEVIEEFIKILPNFTKGLVREDEPILPMPISWAMKEKENLEKELKS